MTPRTRKLLTAAALATAFIAGPAAAQQGAAAPATPPAAAAAPASDAPRAVAARTAIHRAVRGVEAAVAMVSDGKLSCRIGNGKGPMYSETLYECVAAAGQGERVVFVARRGSR